MSTKLNATSQNRPPDWFTATVFKQMSPELKYKEANLDCADEPDFSEYFLASKVLGHQKAKCTLLKQPVLVSCWISFSRYPETLK